MPGSISRRSFLAVAAVAGAGAVGSTSALTWGDAANRQTWLNEPKSWRREGDALVCTADPKTDFWRKTYYGYITDNGHFLRQKVQGDFVATIKVSGQYRDQYDQAGLMIRYDESNWLKCGVEFVDGHQNMSVVFTRDYSDWSTARLPDDVKTLWLKISRKGSAFDIFYALDGKNYVQARSGYLTPAESVEIGPMLAAPEGKGFEARFEDWTLKPA